MMEKRRYHRMKIKLPVSFELGEPKCLIISTSLDISATGISLTLKEPVHIGQPLALTVCVDDNRLLKIKAKVVWIKERKKLGSKEYHVGLKIMDKMDQDEIEFVRFVAKNMIEHFAKKEEIQDIEPEDPFI